MVTPEEEPLILKQFLRFGETRAIVQLMTASPAPGTFSGATAGVTPAAAGGWRPADSGCKANAPGAEPSAGGRGFPPPLLSSSVHHFLPPAQVSQRSGFR